MEPKEQTLTLEAGKFYKTRGGLKAFVAGLSPFDSTRNDHKAIGFIEGEEGHFTWLPTGPFWEDGQQDAWDITSEWVELKRIVGHMNIYAGKDPLRCDLHGKQTEAFGGQVYGNRADADHADRHGAKANSLIRIACIEIDVLEGAGLGEVA